MQSQDHAALWTDETTFPGSTAMILAMRSVRADEGLLQQWIEHVAENHDEGDWICYLAYLEVELEIAVDNMTGNTIEDAAIVAPYIARLVQEIHRGVKPGYTVLQRCTGTRYLINRDAPEEGTDVYHKPGVACPFHGVTEDPELDKLLDEEERIARETQRTD